MCLEMDKNRRDDRLMNHRDAGKRGDGAFFAWIGSNCSKAVSIKEARDLTKNIKKPIRKIVGKECV